MVVGAIYGLRWSVHGAILSVLGGEAMLLGLSMQWIPTSVQAGFLPMVPAVGVAVIILAIDWILDARHNKRLPTAPTIQEAN